MRSLLIPISPLVLTLFAATSGCAPAVYPESTPSVTASGYSASVGSSIGSSSFSGDSFSAPQRGAARGDLVVRPDAIVIVFAVKDTQADAQKAVASLQAYTADMLRRFQEATSGAASIQMCGVSVRPVPGPRADDVETIEYAVMSDGSIEIRLAPEQDYWARSRLLAAMTQTARGLVEDAKPKDKDTDKAIDKDKAKPKAPGVHFNEPQVIVKDPEAFRQKLVERWIKRARDFTDVAQAAAAPLYMVDCAAPAPIEQRPISLEEIGLTLPVTCRVDVLQTPAAPNNK